MKIAKIILIASMGFTVLSAVETDRDWYKGLESSENFLDKSIQAVETDAQRLEIRFSPQEAQGLSKIISEVDAILAKGEANLLESDLTKRLLSLEREWRKREGAWIVVRLLEAVRLKFQLYLQNIYFLKRISGRAPAMEKSTRVRIDRYRQGIAVSNRKLEATLENATQNFID
jgi:hypothetical protein